MSDKHDELIRTARKRFAQVVQAQSESRAESILDMKMLLGGDEQWEPAAREARAGRPTLSINKLPKFLRAVTGDQRQNRPSIKVRPVDSKADPQVATILEGHIRNIEYTSNAAYAYDNAFKMPTAAGFPGYWRILTEYTDDDSFEQDIKIMPIRNHFSVYMDHSVVPYQGKEQFAFVVETMREERFKALYPDVDMESFAETGQGDEESLWFDGEGIRVAEYFYLEPITRNVYQLESGDVVEETAKNKKLFVSQNGQKFLQTQDGLIPVVKERSVKTNRVMWAKLCGHSKPLEGPQEWAGKYIPIIPVMPEELIIEGATYWKGLIRDARDPQRLYNYVASANIEAVALSPKAPFVVGQKQIEGHEGQWANAHLLPYPYLVFNDENGNTQAPRRSEPVQTQPGLITTMQQANLDFEDTIGIFRAGLGAPSNEKSGIAIKERKESSDVGTYEYHDNLSRAINWSYRVLLDLIPRIYDTERGLRLMNPDDTEAFAPINKEVMGPDGEKVIINDISQGKYDVIATLGPAYSTQRQEAQAILSDVLNNIAQVAPQAVPIIMPRLFKLMDYPEAADIAKELEEMFGKGQDQGPNPQQQAAMEIELNNKIADTVVKYTQGLKNIADASKAELGDQTEQYTSEMAGLGQVMQQAQKPQQPPQMG